MSQALCKHNRFNKNRKFKFQNQSYQNQFQVQYQKRNLKFNNKIMFHQEQHRFQNLQVESQAETHHHQSRRHFSLLRWSINPDSHSKHTRNHKLFRLDHNKPIKKLHSHQLSQYHNPRNLTTHHSPRHLSKLYKNLYKTKTGKSHLHLPIVTWKIFWQKNCQIPNKYHLLLLETKL